MADWTHCPFCGTKLDPADTLCRNCGAATPGAPTVPSGETEIGQNQAELEVLTIELKEALAPNLQLLRPLGQGGMGTVFLARDPALKRLVVVKVLSPALAHDENARKRFEREAEAAAAVSHPNVVSVHQVGTLTKSGTSYFVMQHVDGLTLAEAFPLGTVVPEARAKRIIGEVASALEAAHARGLVHRDIKPGNIMLERDTDRVIVLDFGISAAIAPEQQARQGTKLTQEGSSIGTPQYMSPEQAAGAEVTEKSDVYSLGIVAFELVTGRPPFEEPTPMGLIAAHINKEAPTVATIRPDLDAQFAGLINQCLAKSVKDRPSVGEITRQLAPPVHPLTEWPPPGLERLRGSGASLTRLGTAGVVTGLVFYVLLYLQPGLASGSWPEGERSWFWNAVWAPYRVLDETYVRPTECSMRQSVALDCPSVPVDATPLWLFGLAATALLALGLGIRIGLGTVAVIRMLRWARRSGYSSPVLLMVAWDEYPDTVALLNGTGPFAATDDKRRLFLIRRRQLAGTWRTLWLWVPPVLTVLWLLGFLSIGDAADRWLTLWEVLAFTAPLPIAIVGHRWLLKPERQFKEATRARPGPRDAATTAQVPRELVANWAATVADRLGDELKELLRREPLARWLRPAILLPSGLAIVLVSSIAFPMALGGSWFFALWTSGTVRESGADWLNFVTGSERRPSQWTELDSLLATFPELKVTPRADLARATEAFSAADRRAQWTDVPLQAVLAAWRELGAAAGGRARSDFAMAPLRGTPSRFAAISDANLAASRGALASGESQTARLRAEENLALGRYLWHSEDTRLHDTGASVLRAALDALAEVGAATSDMALTNTSRALAQRLFDYSFSHRVFNGFEEILMADPEAPIGAPYVADSRLAPAVRLSLALASVSGLCYNGREMLFGISSRRRALARRVRGAVADIPTAAAALEPTYQDLDGVLSSPRGIFGLFRRLKWCGENSGPDQDTADAMPSYPSPQ